MKILTLNIWGAPYAKHRSERIRAIAEEVRRLNPDILLFQEVYMPNNRQDLISRLQDSWQHFHYFPSALIGSGLLTMSKYLIIDSNFHNFQMQGKPDDILHGDYYAGKGVGLTRIDTPNGLLDIYNSHTHAQYEINNDNEYAVYTDTNLYEVARFIDSHSGANPVILCGDLNARPDQAGYEIITKLGALVDLYYHLNEVHPTTLSNLNPYTNSDDQCLDYVLVRNVGVEKVELVMTENLSGDILAFSDHYGLLAEINLTGQRLHHNNTQLLPVMQALYQQVNDELLDTHAQQMKHLERAVLSFASIFDVIFARFIFKKLSKSLIKVLSRVSVFGAVSFSLWQVIQAGLNLQNRKHTLEGVQQELKKQIDAKRLFDGREL